MILNTAFLNRIRSVKRPFGSENGTEDLAQIGLRFSEGIPKLSHGRFSESNLLKFPEIFTE